MFDLKAWDKIILGVATGAMLLSGAWAGRQASHLKRQTEKEVRAFSPGLYPAIEIRSARQGASEWEKPSAQSQGGEWIYDVFTPPEIDYHPKLNKYSVAPPPTEEPARTGAFGLELAGVRRDLFRAQLVGYVGSEAHALGLFEDRETTGLVLARSGTRVPGLAMTVLAVEMKYRPVEAEGRASLQERTATARVRDDLTGEEVTLTDCEPGYAGPLVVTVVPEGSGEEHHELHPGESLEREGVSYELEGAELAPPRAVVAKVDSDRVILEKRILTLVR